MDLDKVDKIEKAGKIAQRVVSFAKEIIEPGMKLIDLATKIDDKIEELGGRPAFPVNLSINEVAAHFTPGPNEEGIVRGLLKVDLGVEVDGFISDTAFSVDLEDSEENKKLIGAAEEALIRALNTIRFGVKLKDIGLAIERAIKEKGFSAVQNLSGHEIKQYDLHAGLSIPNYDNKSDVELYSGLFAVEPFATNGFGKVRDGKPSGIYQLLKEGSVRDSFARDVLEFIRERYEDLPFCSRWIHKKFGSRGLLALRQIEQAGLTYQYPQLVEINGGKVAQAEHTVLIFDDGTKLVTTRD